MKLLDALRERQRSFYWQVASQYIALSIGISVVFFFALVAISWNFLDVAEQNLEWRSAESAAAEIAPLLLQTPLPVEEVERAFYRLSQLKPGNEFYLLDAAGNVLVANQEFVTAVEISPIREFLASDKRRLTPIYGSSPRPDQAEDALFSAAAVRIGAPDIEPSSFGYLYVVLRGQEWYAMYGMFGNFFAICLGVVAMLLCLLLGAVLGLRIVSRATKRFRKMTTVIQEFARGEFQSRIEDREKDELAEHANAFDSMADIICRNMSELERVEDIRRELMSHVSHDLKTPISVLRTTLESQLIEYDSLDDASRKQLLEQALTSCLSLNELLSQLFEINRIAQRSQALDLESFSFNELVADVCHSLRPAALQRRLRLDEDIDDTQALVQGDIALLERVLRNLVENAIRYSQPSGVVEVRCKNHEDVLVFSVQDFGLGISPEELPLIFDRFYRGASARAHDPDGTGLGLSMVQQILKAHGVEIEVESELGQGTRFSFVLPLLRPKTAALPTEQAEA